MTISIYIDFLSQISMITVNEHYRRRLIKLLQHLKNNEPLKKEKGWCRHHIVPQSWSSGDRKEESNQVIVTAKAHFVIHHLMWKSFPDDCPMLIAFKSMSQGWSKFKYKVTSRLYQKLKIEFSAIVSLKMKGRFIGEKSPRFGVKVGYSTREKMSMTAKLHRTGTHERTEEMRLAHSRRITGIKHSVEGKGRHSSAAFERSKNGELPAQTKVSCIHCKKAVDLTRLSRYHGEKCKMHPNRQEISDEQIKSSF